MGYVDRGLVKWRAASFIPGQMEMLRQAEKDCLKVPFPEFDEYQLQDFEDKILLAMEFASFVNIDVWNDGFIEPFTGRIGRLDEINKRIYLQQEDGTSHCVDWKKIVGVYILDK